MNVRQSYYHLWLGVQSYEASFSW